MANFKIGVKSDKDFYYKWLCALSGMLPLTKKELLILCEFLCIYMDTKERDLFKTSNRQEVRRKLNITTHNINNYINALKNKRAIIIGDDTSSITKTLIPNVNGEKKIDIVISIQYETS